MVSSTSEFAGAEFAGSELAFDGKVYVDVAGAVATLAFTGHGSVGKLVSVVATANMGVQLAPRATAVNSFAGADELEFTTDAPTSVVLPAGASAFWRHTAFAPGAYARASQAAAILSFTATAEPLSGETIAEAQLRFNAHGVIAALAHTRAAATLSFAASPKATAIHAISAGATFQWLASLKVQAIKSVAGYASTRFVANAHTGSDSDTGGDAALSFTARPRFSAVWKVRGAASLTFTANGVTSTRLSVSATGAGMLVFQGLGAAQITAASRAAAGLRFAGVATGARFVSVDGIASLAFMSDGRPGGTVYSSLAASRSRFSVPARNQGWVVPPEPELEEV